MSYWIFQCKLPKYRMNDRLVDPEPKTTWLVNQHAKDIKAGNIAFVWKTNPDRGLCAMLHIVSDPIEMLEYEHEKQYQNKPDNGVERRVEATYMKRFTTTPPGRLKLIPSLEKLSILNFTQRTNFKVLDEEGEILSHLIQNEAQDIQI